ncbi:type IV pilus twitching motility protein PilT [Myxococcota bacterium]|nr:type IV pilus twitching motility protein PilT [Myxococcota bacterium]MBU1537535.1 type IV pilus twitching motility protein PilT [Myxococcota bacterium]
MIEQRASDLHITTGSPPQLRIDGRLIPLRTQNMGPNETKEICYEALTQTQRAVLDTSREIDFSFGVPSIGRFRANIYHQRGAVAGAFRFIPFVIPDLSELGLPYNQLKPLCFKNRGLILVTGPTGSGKSTTLASMLDVINNERRCHIITVEDPIEYLHKHKKSLVNQREVGQDTKNFNDALKYLLRQDPDVVLIGEMRDLETIEAALTIAETGHVVFSTLHTNGAIQAISRILDVFPPHQQNQIRNVLSFVLMGVVSQQLIPKKSGTGRVLAYELLLPNPAIRNLIREDKLHQVYSLMQIGKRDGMTTLNQSLARSCANGDIDLEEAMLRCTDRDEVISLLQKAGINV